MTGAVAVDQLEVIERLGWRRRFFPSAGIRSDYAELLDHSGRVIQRVPILDRESVMFGPVDPSVRNVRARIVSTGAMPATFTVWMDRTGLVSP